MIRGSYYIQNGVFVPATLLKVLPVWEGGAEARVLISAEFENGSRTLTAFEEGADGQQRGKFVREYIEVPSVAQTPGEEPSSFAANLGMEKIGVNFVVGDNDFVITLPSPVDQDGKTFIIKDASGNVDSGEGDRIIINCSAGAVLQGGIEEAVIEVGNGSFEFVSNGSQWLILNDN